LVSSKAKPVIGITMGDPAGSGPEIIIKTLQREQLRHKAKFVLLGDLEVFKNAAKTVNAKDLKLNSITHPSEAIDERRTTNIIDLNNVSLSKIYYGKPSSLGGKSSYEAIVQATKYAMSNDFDAIVTAPISKESLNVAGFNYPGHTELLAELTNTRNVKMMLVAEHFRVVHVTTHVSLKKALELIKKERILKTIKMSNRSLTKLFKIHQPKIAVSGLNPHAGEKGLFGDEEEKEIIPAIKEAYNKGMNVTGPYPPDTVFYRAYYNKEFDVVVAMYHDQGHIATKMVGFMTGVNLSIGLPIIRAAPDHGTVWGKAGKGTADERATLEAIKLVIDLVKKTKEK